MLWMTGDLSRAFILVIIISSVPTFQERCWLASAFFYSGNEIFIRYLNLVIRVNYVQERSKIWIWYLWRDKDPELTQEDPCSHFNKKAIQRKDKKRLSFITQDQDPLSGRIQTSIQKWRSLSLLTNQDPFHPPPTKKIHIVLRTKPQEDTFSF